MKRFMTAAAAATLVSSLVAQPSVPPNMAKHGPSAEGPIADGRWHWIMVEPATYSPTGFLTFTGDDEVTMTGNRCHAELRPSSADDPILGLSINGSMKAGRISATEIVLNTDANPARVHGRFRKTLFRDGVADETIVFRGGQAGEAEYLGIARFVSTASK